MHEKWFLFPDVRWAMLVGSKYGISVESMVLCTNFDQLFEVGPYCFAYCGIIDIIFKVDSV